MIIQLDEEAIGAGKAKKGITASKHNVPADGDRIAPAKSSNLPDLESSSGLSG